MENDKTYLLNIQQQVRKNQIEIELLKSGIKIVGAGEALPASANEGDCYLLGTEGDYELNAYVNGNWIPLGRFPAVGPQGVPGVKGDPAVISYITCAARAIDYGLAPHVSASVNGETVSFDFELPGGPRGLQGPKGEKGDKGDQGNVGPQGPQGEPGNSIRLFQNPSVVTASDLPAASVVGAGVGYLVGTLQDGYELYATANDPLEWVDAGPFIPSQVVVDADLDRLSDNAIQNKPVAKAIGMSGTFATADDVEQGLDLSLNFDYIWSNGYPFSAVDGSSRYKYIAFKEVIGSGGTYNRTYDYITFSHNADGLGVSFAKVTTNSVGLTDTATVDSAGTFVLPKRSELLSVKNSLNAEIARSKAADNLHQKEITLLKNLVYDTVAASVSYSADYTFWMDVPASVEVSGSYHDVLDDAAAQIEVIEGTSVVWNQAAKALTSTDWEGSDATVSFSDGVATFTATAQEGCLKTKTAMPFVQGHKFLFAFSYKGTSAVTNGLKVTLVDWNYSLSKDYSITTSWQAVFEIVTSIDGHSTTIAFFEDNRSSGWDAIQIKNVICIDLTKAFPIDTPTSVDDPRIQAILFNHDLDYDAGSIKSSTVDKVTSHGFNLWDEQWEEGALTNQGATVSSANNIRSKYFNDALPNTAYYFGYSKVIRVCWYDADHAFIDLNEASMGGGEVTSPAGTRYFKICTLLGGEPTYANNICVSKSNVSLNGQYKPWIAPMSVDIEALGVPLSKRKLTSAGTVRDRIYAVMQPDETYQLRRTGKAGVANLAELNWTYLSDAGVWYSEEVTNLKDLGDAISEKYECTKLNHDNIVDGQLTTFWSYLGNTPRFIVKNGSSTTQPSGIVNYELTAPSDELLAEGLAFGELELSIEKGGYLSIDGDGDYYGSIPGLTVDLPILRYE